MPGSAATRPTLQQEPYPLFFVLGLLAAWVGISHWLLYAVGAIAAYSGATHAAVQLQVFEVAFAAGFLFTALPKRTRSPPASVPTLGLTATGLLFALVCASAGRPFLANAGYVLALLAMGAFAVHRLRPGSTVRQRLPPVGFVLIPCAVVLGLLGAALTSELLPVPYWLFMVGSGLIQQGVFFCLVLGIGSLILPLIFGRPPPGDLSARDRGELALLLTAGVLLAATFFLEHGLELTWAISARGLLVVVISIRTGGIHLLPNKAGTQRRVAWISVWLIPTGPILAGLLPDYRVALLHITFIGGFSLLTLAVASHVALGHGGREDVRDRAKWSVIIYGGLVLLAAVTRLASDVFVDAYFSHLAYASASWIVGSVVWVWLVLQPVLSPSKGLS